MKNRTWGIIIGVILIIVIGMSLFKSTGLTIKEFKKPFVVDDIEIAFNSVMFSNKIGSFTPDDGYKFVIINLTAKNIGLEKKNFPFYHWDMKVEVDKGYKYEGHYLSEEPSSMRPEDIGIGYIVFEILEDTYPTKLYIDDWKHGGYTFSILEEDYYNFERDNIEKRNEDITKQQESSQQSQSQNKYMVVSYIVDGDTIKLSNGEEVRLIGLNAPESGQSCFSEATQKLREFVLGKEVTLESDIDDKDQYSRLLRYVYVDDVFVNLEMVRLGFVHKYEYGSNTKYSSQFKQAENEAKQNGECLWKKEDINYIADECFTITNFHFNAAGDDNYNLNDEYVILKDTCDYYINMEGWTVKDETASHIYYFPQFSIEGSNTITLYTGEGINAFSFDGTKLYWGRTPGNYAAIWNNNGDTLFLRDNNGNLVLSQSYAGY